MFTDFSINRISSVHRKSKVFKKSLNVLGSQLRQKNETFEQALFIDISITNTELESLLHEQFLIKEYKPKFNVQFKDDKGYPWIKIDEKKLPICEIIS